VIHSIDLDHLAAGGPVRRLLAWDVVRILDINGFDAGLEFGLNEFEGTRSDLFENRGAFRCVGETLRHHERHERRWLADRLQNQAVGFFQLQRDGLRVGGLQARGKVHELLAHAVACAPAFQRGNAIFRRDGFAIMPFEPVAEGERISELVVGNFPIRHLRLDLEIGIRRQQRVINHVAVIARNVRGG
jgi:hypothetical protein